MRHVTSRSRTTLQGATELKNSAIVAHVILAVQLAWRAGYRWLQRGFRSSPTVRQSRETRQSGVGPGLKEANLPRVRFHDLRHSAASLLIASGVELVEVSQLLGHADIRVTADLYAHLQKETAAKAATIMDGVLGR